MKYLQRADLRDNPLRQFSEWFEHAKRASGLKYPNACCLSTLDPDGYPNARIVLLKEFTDEGFVFFTNANSTKGKALVAHPKAALTFYWDALHRQVRIQGDVKKVSAEESDKYFSTRARESQIGAWASQQSSPIDTRSELEQRLESFRQKFAEAPVSRPEYWEGFRLSPNKIEFWQERDFRLHDRFVYTGSGSEGWRISLLQP